MNVPQLRSYDLLPTFQTLTIELLEIDWVAKTIYTLYAALSFSIFYLTPLALIFYKILHIPGLLFNDENFWSAVYGAFTIFFTLFTHYYVGAYGPGLVRKLLYRVLVQPMLDRIYRENHEEVDGGTQEVEGEGARASFWMRFREGVFSMRGRLRQRRKGYVRVLPDIEEASDALSLHGVPSNSEDLVDTSDRDSDQSATEDDDQPEEQQDGARESSERARRNSAKFGQWVGSKLGAAISYPLKVAIHLGDLSTGLGNQARAMKFSRLQRERRGDLPGDIYLP